MATAPKLPSPPTTEQVLAQMLTENTGRSFLDSGDYYGRHWQQNQGRDFERERGTSLTFKWGYIEVTHNVYHWLKERLDYEPEMDDLFNEFANLPENEDKRWLTLMEEFPKWYGEREGFTVGGIYREGEPMTVNTYNGEDLLSQTLQYTYFENENGAYVLLQIHGGADVRGGYTKPRVFSVSGELSIMDNAHAYIYCTREPVKDQLELIDGTNRAFSERHNWSTDDGHHWYEDGSTRGLQLNQYEIKKLEDGEKPERGFLCVDEDGNGYCPKCGSKLEAFA